MSRRISESDWKILRELQPLALDRFCTQVLAEVGRLIADPGKTHHERYGAVYKLVKQRDYELAAAFDGLARSCALEKLALMRSHHLLLDEEMSRFSPQTRDAVKFFVEL